GGRSFQNEDWGIVFQPHPQAKGIFLDGGRPCRRVPTPRLRGFPDSAEKLVQLLDPAIDHVLRGAGLARRTCSHCHDLPRTPSFSSIRFTSPTHSSSSSPKKIRHRATEFG